MKILYFHQHFSTPRGSTSTRSYMFSKKLIQKGHSVTMVCGSYWMGNTGLKGKFKKGRRIGFVDGIKVIEIKINYSNSDNYFLRTIKFFIFSLRGISISLRENYDIIFCTSTPLTAGIPGIFAKIFKKTFFIFEVRDLWPELPKAMGVIKNRFLLKSLDYLESLIYRKADACIGLSPGIVDGIKNKNKNIPISLIPNGSDLDLAQKSNLKVKQSHSSKFIAVFTGAHGLANGLDKVLDAAKILVKKNIVDIEFHFIGDGLLKKKLVERAQSEKIFNCKFFDPMPKKDLFDYIKANADLGLMILENIPAFYYGTSPNKFFDYISLGVPVLINYPGWISEIILKKNCGISVEPNNPNTFANSIIALKNNDEKLMVMSENAFNLAVDNFDRNKLSAKFIKFVENVFKA